MLRIKKVGDMPDRSIELVRGSYYVNVVIGGVIMARYYDDGKFDFYGTINSPQFAGRWDKEPEDGK